MAFYTAGVMIGNRFYQALISAEQLEDLRVKGMGSEVTQDLLLSQDFDTVGHDVPHEEWETKILYSFATNPDGVSYVLVKLSSSGI